MWKGDEGGKGVDVEAERGKKSRTFTWGSAIHGFGLATRTIMPML